MADFYNQWGGVWNLTAVVPFDDNENYCIPDMPMLVSEPVFNSTAIFAWHYSVC